uniref:Odorant receptor n=1 Tax=Colaphellus bowringi TaxID=561076 RepID=A0A0S3J2M7_9CUCU|nr:odorant receptor OR6 [Colaphellus bowringi]
MYTIKKSQPFYSSLRTLRFFLVYREFVQKSTFMLLSFFSSFMSFSAFLVFVCGCILHAVMSIRENIGGDISEDLSVSIGGLAMMVNVAMFKYHQDKWSNFFKDVTNFEKFGKPTDFDATKDRANLLSTLYMIYCITGTIVYSCVGVIESSCDELSEETKQKVICGTLAPIWLPFEDVSLTVRNTILLVQYVLANYIITPSAVICFLPFETTELLICHINFLKDKLLKVFGNEDGMIRNDKLRFCVAYHTHILGMADQLKYVVKFSVGHMSLVCALVFGCIGNQIFRAKPVGAVIFLLGYMVSLFLLCYAGQRIMNESLSIVDVIYNSKWYKGNTQIKKNVRFMMARCQIPVTLDAWPFGIFSFPLFMMIVKTSYSYLTLLRQST